LLKVYERVSARMASVHPVKRHLFIAPNSKGDCGIFDLRSKAKLLTPVISLLGNTRFAPKLKIRSTDMYIYIPQIHN
jgi:hypothetical protein